MEELLLGIAIIVSFVLVILMKVNMKNNKLDDIDKNAKNTVIKIIEKKTG